MEDDLIALSSPLAKDGVDSLLRQNLESFTLRAGKLSVFEPHGKSIVIHANSYDNITGRAIPATASLAE